MNTRTKATSVLGIAFLLQFITSFSSGSFIRPAWLVPGSIHETLLQIADNPMLLRANILVDMLTALGVILLGAALFATLRKQNEIIALTGLGFYILEGGLLAASKMATFALLRTGQVYASTGQPEGLLAFGSLSLEAMDFVGSTLHALAFCLGAILFYALLYQSRVVPRGLMLWGLITIIPVLAGTLTAMFGYDLPFFLFVPYVMFEPVLGIWFLVKGMPEVRRSEVQTVQA